MGIFASGFVSWSLDFVGTSSDHRVGARLLMWDLMCLSTVSSFQLVGGVYLDGAFCGLWYWNCNNTSSGVGIGTGARLIILVFGVYRALLTLCSCRRLF